MGSKIKVFSSRGTEFYKKFQLGNETYEVVTEDLGAKKAQIVTRIYLRGEILSTTTADYAEQASPQELRVKMEEQRKSAVETFIREHFRPQKAKADYEERRESVLESFVRDQPTPQKTKAEYAESIRLDVKKGNKKAALCSAQEALANFPSDPFFLSYCGYLTAIVEKKSREGVSMCEEAISILRKSGSTDTVFFLPLFYLHLGKVQLKANRKESAIKAFQEGLKLDSSNRALLSEMKAIGTRKGPVISFLDRSNPINRYLGKLRYKLQNRG